MDFTAASHEYLNLRQRLRKHDIDRAQFEQLVANLAVTAPDGGRWRLSPDGAGWLAWDGTAWVAGRPEASLPGQAREQRPAPPGLAGFLPPARPASAAELAGDIVREIVSNVLKSHLITFALVTGLTLLFSAYLMTLGDPGGLIGLLATVFSAKDGFVSMFVLALTLGASITALAAVLRRDGAITKVQEQAGLVPGLLAGARAVAGARGLAWLGGSAAVMLAFLSIVCGRLTALVLAAWIYVVLGAGNRSLPFLAVWLAWQDIARAQKGRLELPPDPSAVFLALAGLAGGAALAFVMPGQPWAGLVTGAALLALSLLTCLGSGVRVSLPRRRGKDGGDVK